MNPAVPDNPTPIEQVPYRERLTPDQLKEIAAAVLFAVGVLALVIGVAILFGAGWACVTGGIIACIAGAALLQNGGPVRSGVTSDLRGVA